MKPFEYNGKRFEFRSVTGEVTGTHKHAETYVSGSGGGGSTHNGHGYTSPVSINSTVVVKQEFFLKPGSGNQVPVQLSAEDIPVMDGQNVTMISGHAGDKAEWTNLVNHSAGLYWKLGNMHNHAISLGLVKKPSLIFWVGAGLWVATAFLLNGLVGFMAAVGYWVYEGMKMRSAAKALAIHLDGLGRETLISGKAAS